MNGVYGTAATGLTTDASFAVNATVAKIGAAGEERTAALLNGFGLKAAVLHDLRVPIPRIKANIDHVIVSGKRVLILDTKVWKPGTYWTLFGKNRRGTERVDHTAKDQGYMQQALITHLRGTGAVVSVPTLVVWPSRTNGAVSLWLLKVPAARLIHGAAVLAYVKRFIGRAPADPVITNKLIELLIKAPARTAATGYDQGFETAPRKFAPSGPNPFN